MRFNSTVWFIGVIWVTFESAHYGWNWSAKTDGEMICDGIGVLIFALACLFPKQPVT